MKRVLDLSNQTSKTTVLSCLRNSFRPILSGFCGREARATHKMEGSHLVSVVLPRNGRRGGIAVAGADNQVGIAHAHFDSALSAGR
jgi:hypothetical protein